MSRAGRVTRLTPAQWWARLVGALRVHPHKHDYILIGLVIGMAMTAGVARLLSATLVGVAANDPLTFGQVAAVIAAMAIVACAVPTVRLGKLVVDVLRTV